MMSLFSMQPPDNDNQDAGHTRPPPAAPKGVVADGDSSDFIESPSSPIASTPEFSRKITSDMAALSEVFYVYNHPKQ